MTVVDSTVWIDLLNGVDNWQTRWLRQHLSGDDVALTDLILCEVLRGLPAADVRYRQVRGYFEELLTFETGSKSLALAAAENYRLLRAKGHTVRSTIDCIIATFCIRNGHALLHNDRDYVPFERHLGLRVIHP